MRPTPTFRSALFFYGGMGDSCAILTGLPHTQRLLAMRFPSLPVAMLLLLPLLVGGCASFSFPYRMEVQQGNILTQEKVNKLKTGMSTREVRYVMGSPLLIDPFHPQRWDYYYSLQNSGKDPQPRHIALFFRDDRLIRIEGDLPSGDS